VRAERAPERRLLLFVSHPHPCGYLAGREATTVFADPRARKDRALYGSLSAHGFRRSGEQLYRPHCRACEACVPVRVPVDTFRPRRSQRRAWRRNSDLRVCVREAGYVEEHFALYRRLIAARHAGGSMDNPTPREYRDFLFSAWAETLLYEFRYGKRLLCVAVTDRLDDAFSAVYTFFDPRCADRSLGVYAVLWQIEAARSAGLSWLYLGYRVEDSPKMRYKGEYLPQERFLGGRWVRVDEE